MRVEGKQTVQVIAAPCKLNPVSSVVKHERSQQANNSDLCRKILDEPRCFSRENLSCQSMSVNNAEEVLNTLSENSENMLQDSQKDRAKESILFNCREYLAIDQEYCGTPRTEYSFAALIVVMAQATIRSLLALIYVIVNLAPIIQMFSFILRFVLDKIIDIRKTKNIQQVTVKLTIFVVQLLSVYVYLIFIFGFIVLPIIQMTIAIATKFVMRN